MNTVLLLNATYEPLRTISYKRAVVLLLQEKAEVVEEGDRRISSATTSFNLPSVIRLKYFVKVPFRSRVALNRRSVIARDGGICQYGCGRKATTIDHVHPRARGGRHEWTNVLAACSKCNSQKADKTLDELGWTPLKQPHVPQGNVWLVVGLSEREEWGPYLELVSA